MNGRVVSGEGLRERRLEIGLKQREVAELAGCSAGYYAAAERGRGTHSEELMARIYRVLGFGSMAEKRSQEMQELHEMWCRDWG